MLEPELQPSNLLLPRTQRSVLRNTATADTQSIRGVARQKPATSPCGIFLIGHVVTQRRHGLGRAYTIAITDKHCREGRDGATTSRRCMRSSSCSYLGQCDVVQRVDRRRGRSRASKLYWKIEDFGFKPRIARVSSAAVRRTEVAAVG